MVVVMVMVVATVDVVDVVKVMVGVEVLHIPAMHY